MYIEPICWYSAFTIGLAGFLYGIIYILRKKGVKEEHFAKAAFFEFAASWILYIPVELFNDIPESVPFLRVIESIFTALLRTFNIYLGNGYSRSAFKGHPIFSSIYATLMTLANIVLLLFVAGFIIKFLDGPLQRIKLSLRKHRKTYVFSVCNEKTLSIAESISCSEKKNIVFANSGKSLSSTSKERIDRMKGIRLDGTVTEILRKTIKKAKGIELFLFADVEEDNLTELEAACKYAEKHKDANVRIYVELFETPWSLYDEYLKTHNAADGKGLVINFVRAEENFAYNNLLKNSIFDNAVPGEDGSVKDIKFLLVGMNDRNLEMFKAVLHLSQMPGYRPVVMVMDPHDDRKTSREPDEGRRKLKQKFPEICDECNEDGDAIYRILYKENVVLESDQFESIVTEGFADFTFAFINAGDDLLNANLAMRLNALRYRKACKKKEDYVIQVNIRNEGICDDWNPALLEHIQVVGSFKKTYDHAFITMSDIERGTIAIHEVRYPQSNPKSPTWISYCNNEYNRHSVYARTLSFKHKVRLIDQSYGGDYSITGKDVMWKKYEHMRWNVYTRTLGYVKASKEHLDEKGNLDKRFRGMAKVHNDLINYYDLPEEEQKKDALKLTPEIVDILKSI